MPLKTLDPEMWKRQLRRVLLVGLPNTWKTSSLVKSAPRPAALIACPGENGSAAIPMIEGFDATVFEHDAKESAEKKFRLIEQWTTQVIGAQKYQSIIVEGLHKLYDVIYEMSIDIITEAQPKLDVEKARWQAFARAEKEFARYIQRVNSSAVPYVFMTVWAAPQADNALDKAGDRPQHYMPAVPGRMLPDFLLGEFGVVASCKAGVQVSPIAWKPGTWQVRPLGYNRGASMKLPPEIAARVPTEVEADWGKFEALVLGK